MADTSSPLFIIDRFEGDWAVIEYGRQTFDFPRAQLPADAAPGDVLVISAQVDRETTTRRRAEIEALAKRVFQEEQPET